MIDGMRSTRPIMCVFDGMGVHGEVHPPCGRTKINRCRVSTARSHPTQMIYSALLTEATFSPDARYSIGVSVVKRCRTVALCPGTCTHTNTCRHAGPCVRTNARLHRSLRLAMPCRTALHCSSVSRRTTSCHTARPRTDHGMVRYHTTPCHAVPHCAAPYRTDHSSRAAPHGKARYCTAPRITAHRTAPHQSCHVTARCRIATGTARHDRYACSATHSRGHARTHACTHARMHAHTHTCTHARMHARTHHARAHARACARAHTHAALRCVTQILQGRSRCTVMPTISVRIKVYTAGQSAQRVIC